MSRSADARAAGASCSAVILGAAVWFTAVRPGRLQTSPDAGVYTGLVRNLRRHLSLTSPTDQFWIRLSPADTLRHLGRIPVADFGPGYPVAVALAPAHVTAAFWLVHLASLVAILAATASLTFELSGRATTAAAATALLVVLPFATPTFFKDGQLLSVVGQIGADPMAVAAVVVAVVATVARRRVATVVAVAAAGLVRYAMLGPLGAVAVVLAARRDPRWRWLAVGFVLPAAVQAFAGAKEIHWHPRSVGPLGVTMAGWVGLDGVGHGTVVVVLAVALLGVVAWRGPAPASMLAAAAVGQVLMLVVASSLLDGLVNLAEERHLVIVRICFVVLATSGITRLVDRFPAPRRGATAAVMGVIVALAILGGGWRTSALRPAVVDHTAQAFVRQHGLPVASNQSDSWYVETGVPAIDLPRTGEPTTGTPRDVVGEVADLANALPAGRLIQAYRPPLLPTVDLREIDCSRQVGPQIVSSAGFELVELDLTACR